MIIPDGFDFDAPVVFSNEFERARVLGNMKRRLELSIKHRRKTGIASPEYDAWTERFIAHISDDANVQFVV